MSSTTSARGHFIVALLLSLFASACNEAADSPVGPELSVTTVVGQLERVRSEPGAAAVFGVEVFGPGARRAVTDEFGHFRLEIPRGEPIELRFLRSDIDATLNLGSAHMPWLQVGFEVVGDAVQVLSVADTPEAEFEGIVSAFSTEGDPGVRTAEFEVSDSLGTDRVVVSEAETAFDPEGDVLSFDALITALEAGVMSVRIEGDGVRQNDGSIFASELKAETDQDDGEEENSGEEDSADDSAEDDADQPEFEGVAALISLEGETPSRTMLVEVTDSMGSRSVGITEGLTLFDSLGDLTSFADLLAALESAARVIDLEGSATLREDGVLMAVEVKAEVEEDPVNDEVPETGETETPDALVSFDGAVALVEDESTADPRSLLLAVSDTTAEWSVRVVEGETLFDNEGDVLSFSDLRAAVLAGSLPIRMEGDGPAGDAGVIRATTIKVEIDD